MADKIKPLKIESPSLGGTQTDFYPTECNPAQDYAAVKGIAFENSDTRLIDVSAGGEIQYWDAITGAYRTFNSLGATGSASGSKNWVQYRGNSAGSFAASTNFQWDDNKTSLQVGVLPAVSLADALATFAKNANAYMQIVVQNNNAGVQASTDIAMTADNGDDSIYYIDMGINSSGYSDGAYPLQLGDDSYIQTNGGNLHIITDTANKNMIFQTGGTLAANERMRFVDAALAKNAYCKLSSHLLLLSDTTANRPTTPTNGMVRYNSSNNKFEGYENGAWVNLISAASASYYQSATLHTGSTNLPYVQFTGTSYVAIGKMVFPGSSLVTLNKILATSYISTGNNMSIRIYDATNSLQIAEKTGITNTTDTIQDLGTISNIPSAQAIFEIQVKVQGGTTIGRASSVLMRS